MGKKEISNQEFVFYLFVLIFVVIPLNVPILDRTEYIGLGESYTLAMCHPTMTDLQCAKVFGLHKLEFILESGNKTYLGELEDFRWVI